MLVVKIIFTLVVKKSNFEFNDKQRNFQRRGANLLYWKECLKWTFLFSINWHL